MQNYQFVSRPLSTLVLNKQQLVAANLVPLRDESSESVSASNDNSVCLIYKYVN